MTTDTYRRTLTVPEVAEILGIARSTAYRLANPEDPDREIPAVRVGRSLRVPAEWVDEILAVREAQG